MNAERMLSVLTDLLDNSPVGRDAGVILSEDGDIVGYAKLVKVGDSKVWYGPNLHIGSELAALRRKTGKHHQLFRWWDINSLKNIKASVARFAEEYRAEKTFFEGEGKTWIIPKREGGVER